MLQVLDAQIRNCYKHAQDCAQRARTAIRTDERDDFEMLEKHWLILARSVEYTRRLELFSAEAKRRHT